jgi:DNA-binding NarL/FixJ family response regulator
MSMRRVVICDDHQIVREALRALIESQDDLEVAGQAADGKEVIPLVTELAPDLVILDIEMPGSDGISVIQQLVEAVPSVGILVFSAHGGPELIRLVAESGAAAFVGKSESSSAILPAARTVLGGGRHFPHSLADATDGEALRELPKLDELDELKRLRSLTSREREVLELFATGMRASGVAEQIGIRPATVYTHIRNAIHKLNVDSRTQAVVIATRYAYLSVDPGSEADD